MTCPYAEHDAAYVLGSLSAAERLEFEQHLAACDGCTRAVGQLAGLPGLLTRVDPSVLDGLEDLDGTGGTGGMGGLVGEPPLPGSLLPHLLHEVRRTRRRRLVSVSALAAGVAAVLTLGLTLGAPAVLGGSTAPPPAATAPVALPMSPVGHVPLRAELAFETVAWGTRLDLACTYVPSTYTSGTGAGDHLQMTYTLYVRTKDGRTQQVGTWTSRPGRTMRLTAATAANRNDIASVEVRTTEGQPVLRLTS